MGLGVYFNLLNRGLPPVIMHHLAHSVLIVLAVLPLCDISMPLIPHWDNMQVKHRWNAAPANWESICHPPAGATIDLHIALKPDHEASIIDALYDVSDSRLSTHVFLPLSRSSLNSVACSISDMVHTYPGKKSLN